MVVGLETVRTPASLRQPMSALRNRLARWRGPLLAVFVFASGFYLWTATSNGNAGGGAGRFYNQLTDAFLHGRLALATPPPRALLALPNPYDPAVNARLVGGSLHDLSLYHGHLYLSWGPTPVVTLYAPWRLLHLGHLPDSVAVALFAIVGLAFALTLLSFLADSYVPQVRDWQVVLGGVALSFGNVIPFLLRRPLVYEVATASGFCFTMASLYLLATGGLVGRYRPRRLAAGSLCAGLAMGGRADLMLLGLAVAVLAIAIILRDEVHQWRERSRFLAVALLPFSAVAGALLVYNFARFGAFFEFGQRYALAGIDQSRQSLLSLSNLGSGLGRYLVQPVRPSFAFPYFVLTPSWPYPGTPGISRIFTGHVEIVGGLLATTPFILFLLPAPWVLRGADNTELRKVVYALAALGSALVVSLALALSVTMRYEVDFATIMLLSALLVWCAVSRHRRFGPVVAGVGAVAILYGSVLGAAISFTGYYDWLRTGQPGIYRALQALTSPLPTLATMIAGHPAIVRIIVPKANYPENLGDYGTNSPGQSPFWLLSDYAEIDIVSPRSDRYVLEADVLRTTQVAPGGTITLLERYRATTLVPVPASGTWDISVALERGLNQVHLAVSFPMGSAPNGHVVLKSLSLKLAPEASPPPSR